MKMLQQNVREMMAKEVRGVVINHSLEYAHRHLEEIKNKDFGSNRRRNKAIRTAERKVKELEKIRA